MNAIKFENVDFQYDKNKVVISDISFCIEEGTTTVILGKNGSGKSTLLKIMMGFEKPLKGNVYLYNRELKSISIHDRSKLLAYVGQDIFSQFDFTVGDYLLFGVTNSLNLVSSPKREHIERVDLYCDKFHISHLKDKKMDRISGGEKQIIMICRAFIQESNIIVLDEPLSALDFSNQNRILNLLKKISNMNKTIIFSSHNPNHALFLNSKVLMLNENKIVVDGMARRDLHLDELTKVYGDTIGKSKEHPYEEFSIKNDEI